MLDQEKHKGLIGQRNRLVFAFLELSGDRIFQRLPEEKKMALVQAALEIGEGAAAWVRAECGQDDPRRIAEHFGLKIFGEDKGVGAQGMKRSEYRPEKSTIVIFRDTLERLMGKVAAKDLSDCLLRFLVAHELFHHLEKIKIGPVAEKFKIVTWRFLRWERQRTIPKLSDVAAQAFTQSLLSLDFSPLVFDYLTYILYADLKK
ncbi:MAG: hypothetical protein WC901_07825 [Candidatus Margulisiibacteriota bacterium]